MARRKALTGVFGELVDELLEEAPRLAENGPRLAPTKPGAWLDEAAAKVPSHWGPGRPAKRGVGRRWIDPENPRGGYIRIDRGDPSSPNPPQQIDHVTVTSNGKQLGRNGQPINRKGKDCPEESHIPASEWVNWKAWNQRD